MTELSESVREFLIQSGWETAGVAPVAGDASARQYFRLTTNTTTAILMLDPPSDHHGTQRFCEIARYLQRTGLGAPTILAENHDAGMLLLEDFGDALFSTITPIGTASETDLYIAATDVLISLHQNAPPDGLEVFSPRLMTEQANLIFEWYAPHVSGDAILMALDETLNAHADRPSVLIHRDFHAGNLILRPDKSGLKRVGLIDFQDAMIGPAAYDLVSLVLDARRDISPDLGDRIVCHYCTETGHARDAFDVSFHVLGLQRNLRILGVFARLALRDGKTQYLEYMPRVWRHINTTLGHPALSDLADKVSLAIPAPTEDILNDLRARCQISPAQ